MVRMPENNRLERIWKIAQVDFKKRYYNTKIGLLWALLNPLFRLFVYYFVFTWLGRQRGENFGIYLFGGILLWAAFTESAGGGMRILTKKKYLIENIQFDKRDLFLSNTCAVFIGFFFNIFAYIIISLLTGIPIFSQIVYVPILFLNLFILGMGVGMILGFINIYLKDIVHLWKMLTMLGFWSAPIIFPLENFVGKLETLLYLNPVSGIIINFRNCVLYNKPIEIDFLVWDFVYAVLLFIIGQYLIKRHWTNFLENI